MRRNPENARAAELLGALCAVARSPGRDVASVGRCG